MQDPWSSASSSQRLSPTGRSTSKALKTKHQCDSGAGISLLESWSSLEKARDGMGKRFQDSEPGIFIPATVERKLSPYLPYIPYPL